MTRNSLVTIENDSDFVGWRGKMDKGDSNPKTQKAEDAIVYIPEIARLGRV